MSDLIRSFRISPGSYRKGEPTTDGRASPFTLPTHQTQRPTEIPQPMIEGVPPIAPPPEDERRRVTRT